MNGAPQSSLERSTEKTRFADAVSFASSHVTVITWLTDVSAIGRHANACEMRTFCGDWYNVSFSGVTASHSIGGAPNPSFESRNSSRRQTADSRIVARLRSPSRLIINSVQRLPIQQSAIIRIVIRRCTQRGTCKLRLIFMLHIIIL